jgi:hypothetical protein
MESHLHEVGCTSEVAASLLDALCELLLTQNKKRGVMKCNFKWAALLCACLLTANADTNSKRKEFEDSLRNIPLPELPAQAAKWVKSAAPNERRENALLAVETILKQHPAAATTVVSAISRVAPETSADVAATAARLSPANAQYIQLAAETGAPSRQAEISQAMRRLESSRGNITTSAGDIQGKNGVGHGPPENPGKGKGLIDVRNGRIDPDDTLPNGKPRHFPPTPPHRPVTPPRPVHYSHPGENGDGGHGTGNGHGNGNGNGNGQGSGHGVGNSND